MPCYTAGYTTVHSVREKKQLQSPTVCIMFTPTIASCYALLQLPRAPAAPSEPSTNTARCRSYPPRNGPSQEKFHPRRARFSLLKANQKALQQACYYSTCTKYYQLAMAADGLSSQISPAKQQFPFQISPMTIFVAHVTFYQPAAMSSDKKERNGCEVVRVRGRPLYFIYYLCIRLHVRREKESVIVVPGPKGGHCSSSRGW